MLLGASGVQAQVHVSLAGSDITGDGTVANPYRTIGNGISNATAGQTIFVIGGGVFDEANIVDKPLTLTATDPNTTLTFSGSALAILDVRAQGVTIEKFNFEINQPGVTHGIYGKRSVAQFNGVTVRGNTFVGTGVNGVDISSAATFDGLGSPVQTVTLVENRVDFVGNPLDTLLDRGFWLEGAVGTVGTPTEGNTFIAARRQDVLVRFNPALVTVQGNTFRGPGVDVSGANNQVAITGNDFNAIIPGVFAQGVIVKGATGAATQVTISGNTFTDYTVGVFSGGSNKVTVTGNTFNGSSSAFESHVIFDTGYPTASRPGPSGVRPNEIVLTGNTFNQSPVPGTGLTIANSWDDLHTIFDPFGPGTTIAGNIFNYATGDFIRLSDAPFPVADDFAANGNQFFVNGSLKNSTTMSSLNDQVEVALRTIDNNDNPVLGSVIYDFPPAVLTEAFVSASGNDSNIGTIDFPFQTIGKGVAEVVAGGKVTVINGGVFDEAVTITKTLELSARDADTTITYTGGPALANVAVQAPNVVIRDFGFELRQPAVNFSVYATHVQGAFGGLTVANNTFTVIGNNTTPVAEPIAGAVRLITNAANPTSVNLLDNRLEITGVVDVTTVPALLPIFDRGFWLSQVGGTISGNVMGASGLQEINLGSTRVPTTVSNNTIGGNSVHVVDPRAVVTVSDNLFSALIEGLGARGLLIRSNNFSPQVLVENNTFQGFLRGISSEVSRNVVIQNNTFNGSADNFVAHVEVNSGVVGVAGPVSIGYSNDFKLLNNTFNQSPVEGPALLIGNEYAPKYSGPVFNTAATEIVGNVFNYTGGEFFRLQEAPFPVVEDFVADTNSYLLASGLKTPPSMVTLADQTEINSRIFDKNDDATLGEIILNLPASPVLDEAFVSLSGSDVTGNGLLTNPFRTIGKGVAEVVVGGKVTVINGGVFDEAVTITKTLELSARDADTTLTFSGSSLAILDIQAQDVTVENFNFEVSQPNVVHGIYGKGTSAAFNGLTVRNNTFVGTGINGMPITSACTFDSLGSPVQSVTLVNNRVDFVGNPVETLLDRGFWLEGTVGTVGGPGQGNTFIAARRQDVLVRFNPGPVTLQENTFRGPGVDISEALNAVSVAGNNFDAIIPGVFSQGVIVKESRAGATDVSISGNTFTGYPVGVFSGGSNKVTVTGNTFNGSSSAFESHVIFDTGYPTALRPGPSVVRPNEIILTGNTFNQSPVPGVGLTIANSWDDLHTLFVPFGPGTVISGNVFNYNSGDFIRLSDAPFAVADDFDASNNNYLLASGLKTPAAMTTVVDQFEINSRIFDKNDDATLGEVILNLPPGPILDEAFVSLSGSDVTGNGLLSNPFRTIGKGVAEVVAGGKVTVINGGVFDEAVTITKTLELSARDADTTITYTGGPALANVAVQAPNVVIRDFGFELRQPAVNFSVYATHVQGAFGGLTVSNNTFTVVGNNTTPAAAPVAAAVRLITNAANPTSVNLLDNRLEITGVVDVTTVPALLPIFDRGFWLTQVGGTISGNVMGASGLQEINLGGTRVPTTVSNNTINGNSVHVVGARAAVTVSDNLFSALVQGLGDTGLLVRNNDLSPSVLVENNTFEGFLRGISSEVSRNVVIQNNTFNGSADNFVAHVEVNSGVVGVAGPVSISYSNDFKLLNNTFNQSPVEGPALLIGNEYAPKYSGPVFNTAVTEIVGNVFNYTGGEFFRLQASPFPVVEDFVADTNSYLLASGLTTPGAATLLSQQNEFGARTFDKNDNPILGEIIYNFPPAVADADLEVAKSASVTSVTSGNPVTFILTVTNNGPEEAANVVLTDTVPAGFTVVSASADVGLVSISGNDVTWTISSHPVGLTATITVEATATTPGLYTNTAEVSSDTPDAFPGNNSSSVDVEVVDQLADLVVTKDASSTSVVEGEPVTFTITVTNAGPDAASNVVLSDMVPAGFTVDSVSADVGDASHSGNDVTWTIATHPEGVTATITVEATAVAVGSYTNVVTVSSDTADPVGSNNSASVDVEVVPPSADLSVVKSASAPLVRTGDSLTFTVVANNAGPQEATAVQIVDVVPAGLTIVSASSDVGTVTVAGDTVTVDIPVHPVGVTATVTIEVTADAAGSYTNVATVSSATSDPDGSNNSATADVEVADLVADLVVTKDASSTSVVEGQPVTFTITVTNAGPDAASNVVLSDMVPAGFTVDSVSADVGDASHSGNDVTWTIATHPEGVTATITVEATAVAVGSYTNVVTVSSDTADPDSSNNSASVDVEVVPPSADLSVVKSASAPLVRTGDSLTFTVVANNAGPQEATAVQIVDVVPAGLTIVSASSDVGTVTVAGDTVTVDIPVHPVGVTATVTIEVTADAAGSYTNVATVSSATSDPDGSNNSATADVEVADLVADLVVTKDASSTSVVEGQPVTFTITVTNAGPDAASNVVLSDMVPAGFTVDSVSADVGDASHSGNDVTWTIATHPEGVTATITVEATAVAVGSYTNVVTVSSDTADPVGSNNSASVDVEVLEALADLAVTKTASAASIGQNETVTFTVTVSNNGDRAADNVVVTDEVPAGFIVESATAGSGSVDVVDNTVVLTVGSLPVGETVVLTIVARGTVVGDFVNTASATTDTPESETANNSASAPVSVVNTLDVLVSSLTASSLTPPLGLSVTFTAQFSNPSLVDATGVVARVSLPFGYLLTNATSPDGSITAANGVATLSLASLPAGQTVSIVVTAQPQVTVASTITANVTATGDSDPSNNSATLSVTADPSVIPASSNDFSEPLDSGSIIPLGGSGVDLAWDPDFGAYRARVFPAAALFTPAGFFSEGAESLPYSAVGPDRVVRGKFSVYQADLDGNPAFAPETLPNLRLRLSNRFAVSSILEIFSHVEGDPAGSVFAAEMSPSADPSQPSVYRVDYNPVDVPYLQSNPGEGIRYGFELLKASSNAFGAAYLTDVSLGTYSIFATTSTPALQTFVPSGSDAGGLSSTLPDSFLARNALIIDLATLTLTNMRLR